MAAQREWLEKDYYQILGVSSTATDKEITRAYRKLAKQYHPDANPGAEDRFKEITAAYDVLGDAAKRKEYDEVRRLGASGFGGFPGAVERGDHLPGGGPRRPRRPLRRSGGRFGGGRRGRNAGPRRGADVEAELHLSFEDAVRGVTTPCQRGRRGPLRDLPRHGGGPGDPRSPVPRVTAGAPSRTTRACSPWPGLPPVLGRGTIIEKPCPTCRGSGVVRRTREVKVRIPAGVEDGQRIRVKGRGAAGRANGPAGDLFVRCTWGPTPSSAGGAAT